MIIFLTSHRNKDGSDEGSQHMFLCRINKKIIPNYHQILPLSRALVNLRHHKLWYISPDIRDRTLFA